MSQGPLDNPFDPARGATAATFVGRADLLRQLTAGLGAGRSYELVGEPGIGKTCLLRALERRLAAPPDGVRPPLPLPVYVECERRHEQVEAILAGIAGAVADALDRCRRLVCPPDLRSETQAVAQQGRLDQALEALAGWTFGQAQSTYRIVLLLDALHRISGLPSAADLTSKLYPQVARGRIAVVLAGRRPLVEEVRDDVSRLRDLLTQQFELGPFDRAETRQLVALAERQGWQVAAGVADRAHRLTGGHPYRLQYYLQAALAGAGADGLTERRLRAVHRAGTIAHLNRILLDRRAQETAGREVIFVSYSHRDEREKQQLMTHLGVLGNVYPVDAWSDDRAAAGTEWQKEIERVIARARLAVLLISANFLTSEFIRQVELPRLLARHRAGALDLMPVIAHPSAWRHHEWLAGINVRPKGGKAVWRDEGKHADEDLTDIVNEIAALLKRRRGES